MIYRAVVTYVISSVREHKLTCEICSRPTKQPTSMLYSQYRQLHLCDLVVEQHLDIEKRNWKIYISNSRRIRTFEESTAQKHVV